MTESDMGVFQEIAASLAAEGYFLDVEPEDAAGRRLRVTIRASEDACEDCLIPKPMMLTLMRGRLGDDPPAITLVYPKEI
jgi:hypothetical protein